MRHPPLMPGIASICGVQIDIRCGQVYIQPRFPQEVLFVNDLLKSDGSVPVHINYRNEDWSWDDEDEDW